MGEKSQALERLTRFGVAGAVAAFFGFVLLEPFTNDNRAAGTYIQVLLDASLSFALFGAIVSLGLVLGEEFGNWQGRRIIDRGWKAAAVGAVGGFVAGFCGQFIYSFLQLLESLVGAAGQILARSVGWAVVGVVIGAATGFAGGSSRKALLGAVGGLIGGGLGGLLFDLVGMFARGGTMSRFIGFTVVGLATGLAIALVAEIAKQAWIVILSGPKEGKEYILTKSVTTIGRDELADIPLFGDRAVARSHATISSSAATHTYHDEAGGSTVNGQSIQQKQLVDGDTIRIGSISLRFRTRGGPRGVYMPAQPAQQPVAQAQPGICPFCGQAFDSAGQCACSVGGTTGLTAVTPAKGVMPRLKVTTGPYAGGTFDILEYSISIGRDASNTIALEQDMMVSRRHATLSYENGSYILRDTGSSNGTFVNGARITELSLTPGDMVQIGGTGIIFVVE